MEEPSLTPPKTPKAGPPVQITIKNPEWGYARLKMIYDPPYTAESPSYPPDILTWRTTLTMCLTQFLGLMGSAIHIDILHLENDEAWLRLPQNDTTMFAAAVSGYVGTIEGKSVGFKTLGMGDFPMGVVGKGEEDALWA
ncbi:uncharacterized protein H6S33_006817 [Morchella sextelata]|uniref:uncharacterized protein n=1 Tax=Morchella sextelata TaxID=1174677 RepID=UPI001D050024|nr:uncharacterized protein H6S33_006817 [Morchella sextelata]KAH0604440.1 hypothetical protein H6S33_006817 [Morchella sextelata]